MIRITKNDTDPNSPNFNEQDYTLDTADAGAVWLTVNNIVLIISGDDEGVLVSAYRNNDEMGRTQDSMYIQCKET